MPRHKSPSVQSINNADLLITEGEGRFYVQGLWCNSCARSLEKVLERQPGIQSAEVHFATATAFLRWTPQVSLEAVSQAAAKLGYPLQNIALIPEQEERIAQEVQWIGIRLAAASFIGMWVMALALTLYTSQGQLPYPVRFGIASLEGILTAPLLLFCGWPFLMAGWRTLIAGVPAMDFLVALAAINAFLLSTWQLFQGRSDVYFDTTVAVITLMLTGRLLEMRALQRSRKALRELSTLHPESLLVANSDGDYLRCPLSEAKANQKVKVLPGERIGVDIQVTKGSSWIDNRLVSGESIPRYVEPGDILQAGTCNGYGTLEGVILHGPDSSSLAQLKQILDQLLSRPSQLEQVSETWARRLVPIIFLLGIGAALLPSLRGDFAEAILRMGTVWVITCPCALSIATPLVAIHALTSAAKRGIHIRDVQTLETLAQVKEVWFDKTGTLTNNRFHIQHVQTSASVSSEQLLAIAAQLEQGSNHPFAQAFEIIRTPCPLTFRTITTIPGGGLIGETDQGRFFLGQRQWVYSETQIELPAKQQTWSEMHLATQTQWLGSIYLSDQLRPDAKETIDRLQQQGLQVGILSGDHSAVVKDVSQILGIQGHGDCTPEAKAAFIQSRPCKAIFVGDGLNDAPALAAAAVGIASAESSNLASQTAPVILREPSSLQAVPQLLALAYQARQRMIRTLTWGLVYNSLAIPIAWSGMLSPTLGAIAMTLSALSVVTSALLPWPQKIFEEMDN